MARLERWCWPVRQGSFQGLKTASVGEGKVTLNIKERPKVASIFSLLK